MILYRFTSPAARCPPSGPETGDLRVLERVAEGSDTRDLVVALYLLPGVTRSRGTAFVRRWMTPDDFETGRGNWAISRKFPRPADLPERFKLIRMRLDPNPATYPREERDGYRWWFRYGTFSDHLAALFAHELHHFRRHHLNLHPREGEHAANRWALDTAVRLGFSVEGKRLRPVQRTRRSAGGLFSRWSKRLDRYARFRGLAVGARVKIEWDPRQRYGGQIAELVRPVRSNAKRMVIRTPDGLLWRWPMAWVKAEGNPAAGNIRKIE